MREARLHTCTVVSNSAYYGGGTSSGSVSNSLIACNTSRYGGVCNGTLIDCVIAGNDGGDGGGVRDATLRNCTITNNTPCGSKNCTFYDCVLAGNRGYGAAASTLYDCVLAGNQGYGATGSTLYDCVLTGNQNNNGDGGGADSSTLYNCVLTGNNAQRGAGANRGALYNCLLAGNTAAKYGGGVYGSALYNCTVVGNYAIDGGGVYSPYFAPTKVFNSIVYFNDALNAGRENWWEPGYTIVTNSCTYPAIAGWAANNTTNDPMFIARGSGYGLAHVPGDYRLRRGSPCIDAGTNMAWITAATLDLDGAPRIRNGVADMGAYEFVPAPKGTLFLAR